MSEPCRENMYKQIALINISSINPLNATGANSQVLMLNEMYGIERVNSYLIINAAQRDICKLTKLITVLDQAICPLMSQEQKGLSFFMSFDSVEITNIQNILP